MGELAGCRSAPVMRIERVGEEGIGRGLGLDELRDHLRAEVGGGACSGVRRPEDRRGVPVGARRRRAGRRRSRPGARLPPGAPGDRALLELLLDDALVANASTGDPLPLQVHCGFGDADLFLPRADPALLGPLVERYPDTPFVLLHCYPFVRQAGWLAHVYGNVFLDVSLDDPARVESGRDDPPGLRAGAGVQAPVRLGRGANAGSTGWRRPAGGPRWPTCSATRWCPPRPRRRGDASCARTPSGCTGWGRVFDRSGAERRSDGRLLYHRHLDPESRRGRGVRRRLADVRRLGSPAARCRHLAPRAGPG